MEVDPECTEECPLSQQLLLCEQPPGPPLVHIEFYDNGHSQGIYQLIEAYMLSLQTDPLSQDLKQQVTAVSRDSEPTGDLQPGERPPEGDQEEMEVATPNIETEFKGQVEYYTSYCLDKFPMTYKTQVVFDRIYSEPFWIDPFVAKEEKRLRKMAIKCFNCGEDHHINQCTEPRDVPRIMAEIRLYKESQGVLGSDKRYHLNTNAERFAKFCPGLISPRLRQALGIGPTSIPPYIPRMHLLGYPPGYKLQAEEKVLLLYNSPDTGEPPSDPHDTLKNTKVIIYPGFNDHEMVKTATPPATTPPVATHPVATHPVAKPPVVKPPGDQKQGGVGPGPAARKGAGARGRGKGKKKKKKAAKTMVEDDLGTLSDYELEELDGADGEMVIGFCVKKTPGASGGAVGSPGSTTLSKSFSLDFPPGLVDLEAPGEPLSEKWNAIKSILINQRHSNLNLAQRA